MNILLTSVGRRAYLVRYFKNALAGRGRVFAINSVANAAGMFEADQSFISPRVDSANYIDFVKDIIQKYNIKLVLSLFDIDLAYLAGNKTAIEALGAKLVVSSTGVVDISNDKWKTHLFCQDKGFLFPKTYISLEAAVNSLRSNNLSFPLILKPRWGMGSLSVFTANDPEELRFYYSAIKKQILASYLRILSETMLDECVLIQECIAGEEFGLDVFNDLNGHYIQTVVKKKIAMRSGETDIAQVFSEHELSTLGKNLSASLRHVGNLDVDIMLTPNMEPYIIEFNARFGGGYPFSHLAGAGFPEKLINMIEHPGLKIQASQILDLKAYKDINPLTIDKN